MEPAQQENPTYKRDENGDEMLMEGVFAVERFCLDYIILVPLGLCTVCCAAKHWRLCLTQNSIKYRHPILYDYYGHYDWDIPLEDITDVMYDRNVSMSILLGMEPARLKSSLMAAGSQQVTWGMIFLSSML